jgi:ABC-type bacteriocin/lantibiotic exporter with double-glycine peptidase domain
MPKRWALCVAALAAAIMAAQSPPPSAQALPTSAQAPRGVWLDVPFVHQPREGCGAAALAMVIKYWAAHQGGPASPADAADVDRIQHQLYVPRQHGIPASAMQSYLQQHGFRVFALSGRWSDLEEQLGKGRPLIAAIRPQGQKQFHYVVIDGVDPARGMVMMNDPAERKLLSEERAAFEKDWGATHNWMMLAVPAAAQ